MPRFNVQHPVTKEWRCFSTVVDDYVTNWMDEERYQRWRLFQYGQNAGAIRDANLMDYEEAEQRIADRKQWDAEDEAEGEKQMEGKYTLRVETEGIEEATEQVEKLADAYDGFPAQVTIKNCRDCTFNIYPSQIRTVEAEGNET